MARQPKQSAFVLATKILSRFQIFIRIFLLISLNVVRCDDNSVGNSKNYSFITITNSSSIGNSVSSYNSNNNGTASILNQPKFGDRLLPRHRQFGSNNQTAFQSNSVNSLSKILDSNYSNNNLNSNKNASSAYTSSNNSLSSSVADHHHINEDHILQIDTDQINRNGDSLNNYPINNNNDDRLKSNSIKYISSTGHHNSGNFNNNNNDRNNILISSRDDDIGNLWWVSDREKSKRNNNQTGIDAIAHDVAPSIVELHETQQQLRRNDYDIDHNDLLDHKNMNVSKADRLIEMSTEFFIVPSSTTSNPQDISQQNHRSFHDQQYEQHQGRAAGITPRPVLILAARTPPSNLSVTPPSIISVIHLEGLRKEPWVVPVLVLASLSMIMMAAFEIFVLFKAWRTSPSRRHLFLGQMLLLGLFACAGLGAVLTANPSILSCATVRFGVGFAYALVFAALLVKCVFLISLNGGVYLPAPYQGLLLLFAVLIQVAIGTQWLMTQPPDIQTLTVPIGSHVGGKFSMLITSTDISRVQGTTVISLCKTQFSEFLLSLIYIVFLIIFVTVLAIKSRGIRDNYREATYIGLAIGGAIPIWLGWTLCGLAVADRHKDACLAFGLVATSATVFLVMFMPKGRQLAAMGKEGLYVEDREEQFSSLSRAGSGYSPSFFHFKPIKYGVMGHIQNSTTNTGNGTGNNTKHQNTGTTLGGGLFMRSDEANVYTTLEPTLSSNPNVYFQRSGGVHPGMMY